MKQHDGKKGFYCLIRKMGPTVSLLVKVERTCPYDTFMKNKCLLCWHAVRTLSYIMQESILTFEPVTTAPDCCSTPHMCSDANITSPQVSIKLKEVWGYP